MHIHTVDSACKIRKFQASPLSHEEQILFGLGKLQHSSRHAPELHLSIPETAGFRQGRNLTET